MKKVTFRELKIKEVSRGYVVYAYGGIQAFGNSPEEKEKVKQYILDWLDKVARSYNEDKI